VLRLLRCCPCAIPWSADDAQAWWDRYGSEITAHHVATADTVGQTIQVDLAARARPATTVPA
jgi:hypothetical protein